jgi:hypothetical protein
MRATRARRVDWNRVYELEMRIYGHVHVHLGASSVFNHPAFHPAAWRQEAHCATHEYRTEQ